MRRPDLLLLDEPLDSLDVTNQAAVSALIQTVCRTQNVAVLLVAHDVNPILPYLDQVIYLAHGGAVMGPGAGDHRRHADACSTARRSTCCATGPGGWWWSASPTRPPTHPGCR